jgi:hypothetical protein
MHQALKHFDKQFPGLEMSAVFVVGTNDPDYVYYEKGLSAWPTSAYVELPIFEKLSDAEEARLGNAGIRKKPVGKLVLEGNCSYGCASVKLTYMKVVKLDGKVVWEKSLA